MKLKIYPNQGNLLGVMVIVAERSIALPCGGSFRGFEPRQSPEWKVSNMDSHLTKIDGLLVK